MDEGGVKKAKFSTFKKIKNKEQLVEEVKKQEEDAAFLDEMFQDNLSDDTEHQDDVRKDQIRSIKKDLRDRPGLQETFMKNLTLPEFDPNEDPRKLKNQLMEQNDEENEKYKREAAKKREEIRQKMEARGQNVQEIPKGSVGQWKAIGKTLLILLRIRKEAVAIRLKKREEALKFYERFL